VKRVRPDNARSKTYCEVCGAVGGGAVGGGAVGGGGGGGGAAVGGGAVGAGAVPIPIGLSIVPVYTITHLAGEYRKQRNMSPVFSISMWRSFFKTFTPTCTLCTDCSIKFWQKNEDVPVLEERVNILKISVKSPIDLLRASKFNKTGLLGIRNDGGDGGGGGVGRGGDAGGGDNGDAAAVAFAPLDSLSSDAFGIAQSSEVLLKWLALAEQVQAHATPAACLESSKLADDRALSHSPGSGVADNSRGSGHNVVGHMITDKMTNKSMSLIDSRPSSSESSSRDFHVRPMNETSLKILRLWVQRAKRNHQYPNLRGTD
jgi:hypothetical protein